MKYTITNNTKEMVWTKILLEIEKGETPEIHCWYLKEENITKLAGLGVPIYIDMPPTNRKSIYKVIDSLRLHCVEDINICFAINIHSRNHVYDFINDVQDNMSLVTCKVVFIESTYTENNKLKLDPVFWNNLIVFCKDHMIPVIWNEGASYRYSIYDRMIKD